MSRGPVVNPDRAGTSTAMVAALTAATVVVAGIAGQTAAQGQLTPVLGTFAGVVVALLSMVGLQSVSIRLIARQIVLVSAVIMVRFGVLSGSLASGAQLTLLWLVGVAAVFVLTDRIGTDANPALLGETGRPTPARTARTVALVGLVVVVGALALTPIVLPHVGQPSEAGEGANLDPLAEGSGALTATNSLDMTSRPDLTDEVVFTVETNRASFWRGETFDVWDGRRWTRSDPTVGILDGDDRVRLSPDDLGATGSDVVEQRFRLDVPYADIVYAAPSATEVQISGLVRQRPDGTLIAATPLGRGATYTVTSRRAPLSAERLRTVTGDIPSSVADRYAQEPETSDRVLEAAREVAGGEASTYDQILALQAWMGERAEYSLDAPLAPKDVDVVDHFLFEAEQGWCEQIASSLVVMARANGIPARLVTGFVPDERDPITGIYTVRERDSHAWAEVWFPEVGWVPFDPTADVPLAGEDAADPTVGEWLLDHLVIIVLAIFVVGLAAGPARSFVRTRWARRAARPRTWAAVSDASLDQLGAKVDRPRRSDETSSSYADALADRYGDPRLSSVGRLIDDTLYAGGEVAPEAQRAADDVLAEVGTQPHQ